MNIDVPPSYQAGRLLMALTLLAVCIVVTVVLVFTGAGQQIVDYGIFLARRMQS
jgi:hypothetical protein